MHPRPRSPPGLASPPAAATPSPSTSRAMPWRRRRATPGRWSSRATPWASAEAPSHVRKQESHNIFATAPWGPFPPRSLITRRRSIIVLESCSRRLSARRSVFPRVGRESLEVARSWPIQRQFRPNVGRLCSNPVEITQVQCCVGRVCTRLCCTVLERTGFDCTAIVPCCIVLLRCCRIPFPVSAPCHAYHTTPCH